MFQWAVAAGVVLFHLVGSCLMDRDATRGILNGIEFFLHPQKSMSAGFFSPHNFAISLRGLYMGLIY